MSPARCPTATGVPGLSADSDTGTSDAPTATHAAGPPPGEVEETATAVGPEPTATGGSGRCVARSTGVTVPSPKLATKAVLPLGVTATASGSLPTLMGASARC